MNVDHFGLRRQKLCGHLTSLSESMVPALPGMPSRASSTSKIPDAAVSPASTHDEMNLSAPLPHRRIATERVVEATFPRTTRRGLMLSAAFVIVPDLRRNEGFWRATILQQAKPLWCSNRNGAPKAADQTSKPEGELWLR